MGAKSIIYMLLLYAAGVLFLVIYYTIIGIKWYLNRNKVDVRSMAPEAAKPATNPDDPYTHNVLLGIAQSSQTAESINAAIRSGAFVDERSDEGMTPLIEAARVNQNVHVLFALLNNGANVNAMDKEKRTALMWAAGSNPNYMVISALIEAGANLDQFDGKNKTALMYAAQYSKNPAVISTLLKAGANKTLRSYSGKTAYDYAHENRELYKTPVFEQLK